jgi:hypothetical protein
VTKTIRHRRDFNFSSFVCLIGVLHDEERVDEVTKGDEDSRIVIETTLQLGLPHEPSLVPMVISYFFLAWISEESRAHLGDFCSRDETQRIK